MDTLLAIIVVLVVLAVLYGGYHYLQACHQGHGGVLCSMWHALA